MNRSPTGHRIGEWHQNVKHPDHVVKKARKLREQGWSYMAIGHEVGASWRTVADWVNYVTRYDV